MANEGNEGRISSMDLNLYLGFPRSPRPSSLSDLGSDLALGSLPLPILTTEESTTLADMSGTMEPPDSHAPYSPLRAPYNPDVPSVESVHPADDIPSQEYTPDEPYGLSGPPVLPIMLELEGSEGPHSPVPTLPTVQEDDELQSEGYEPVSPPWPEDRASPQGNEPHVPYSPTYSPTYASFPATSRSLDEVDFGLYRPLPGRGGEFLSREDWSSSRRDIFRSSTFRLRTLSEVTHQLRHRQFRMSPPYDGESSNIGRPSSPIAEQLVHDIMSSQRDLGVNRKHEAPAKHFEAEGSDNEMKEKNRNASNFECNICLDMAKEPVVTSCGHLFCWPCLFQWLHIHSDHSECPVCKGEVIESNITPIYGRGSSEEKKLEKNDEESGLKIPPRPHGNRFESFRQQVRSFPRRLGENIATSWRRLMDRRIRNRNNGDQSLLGIYDGGHHPLTRMRARRMQREEGIPESESIAREIGLLPRDGAPIPQSSSSSLLFRDGIDLWRRFSFHSLSSERLADMAADLGSVDWRIASSSNQYAASTSSVNPLPPEPQIGRPPVSATLAADQASASSTMAVIQEDFSANDISVDPNVAGSSRSHRRRGRSSTSGSLDIDGGNLHARKRRRLD